MVVVGIIIHAAKYDALDNGAGLLVERCKYLVLRE